MTDILSVFQPTPRSLYMNRQARTELDEFPRSPAAAAACLYREFEPDDRTYIYRRLNHRRRRLWCTYLSRLIHILTYSSAKNQPLKRERDKDQCTLVCRFSLHIVYIYSPAYVLPLRRRRSSRASALREMCPWHTHRLVRALPRGAATSAMAAALYIDYSVTSRTYI